MPNGTVCSGYGGRTKECLPTNKRHHWPLCHWPASSATTLELAEFPMILSASPVQPVMLTVGISLPQTSTLGLKPVRHHSIRALKCLYAMQSYIYLLPLTANFCLSFLLPFYVLVEYLIYGSIGTYQVLKTFYKLFAWSPWFSSPVIWYLAFQVTVASTFQTLEMRLDKCLFSPNCKQKERCCAHDLA